VGLIQKIENFGFETELFTEIYNIGGEKALYRFINLALENINNRFNQLEKVCANDDFAGIEGAVHSLRGSAMNIGYTQLALSAEKYELLAEAKRVEAFDAYEALLPQMNKIEALLELMETDCRDGIGL
jgi:HPt (histidine-containing phosphotransfer) domain-containing protein